MANITLRLVKGSPLTNAEVDNNFSNLNISKIEIGGDISGNIFVPVISGIQGRSISNIAPSNGQALVWISGNNKWEPGNVATGGGGTGSGSFYFSNTAPSSPAVGDRWVHSDTGIMYQYINDGDSSQWVNVTNYVSLPPTITITETLSPFLLMGA